MEPDLGPSARAFRDEVRAWLESNRPEGLVGVEAEQLALRRVPGAEDWARKLHDAGFIDGRRAAARSRLDLDDRRRGGRPRPWPLVLSPTGTHAHRLRCEALTGSIDTP